MSGWPRSIWAEARQINALLRWPAMRGDGAHPRRFFEGLREEGRNREAIRFVAQALPRYEAVHWSHRTVAHHAAAPDPAAMGAIAAWLAEPSDARRRAAHEAARNAPAASPARLCGIAVFLSGGSLAAVEKPPRLASRDATGRFAAAAVIVAAAGTATFDAVIEQALDLGDQILQANVEKAR